MLNSKEHKFTMLINTMPTVVGIVTFISMINTTYEILKGRKVFIFSILVFYEQLKFHAQLTSFITYRPCIMW